MNVLHLTPEQFEVLQNVFYEAEDYEERIKEQLIDDLRALSVEHEVQDFRDLIDQADKSIGAYQSVCDLIPRP